MTARGMRLRAVCNDQNSWRERRIQDTITVMKPVRAASRLSAGGNDYYVGPLSMPRQLEIVEEYVADAIATGAKLRCGRKRTGEGLWFQPTVLDNCTQQMKVVADETFGPVVSVVRVKNVEAIAKANDNAFGLNASIWSEGRAGAVDLGKGSARMRHRVREQPRDHRRDGVRAVDRVKASGYGIATGQHSLIFFTRPKTTLVDTSPGPDPWWLPTFATMVDVGERLALAQCGQVTKALKVLLLMRKRVQAIWKLVRG